MSVPTGVLGVESFNSFCMIFPKAVSYVLINTAVVQAFQQCPAFT